MNMKTIYKHYAMIAYVIVSIYIAGWLGELTNEADDTCNLLGVFGFLALSLLSIIVYKFIYKKPKTK